MSKDQMDGERAVNRRRKQTQIVGSGSRENLRFGRWLGRASGLRREKGAMGEDECNGC